MTLFIKIVTVFAFLTVRSYEEITGRKYSKKDEGRLIMMTFFIILAVLAILFSLIFIGSELWDVFIGCFYIVFLCGMAAYILYYHTGRDE